LIDDPQLRRKLAKAGKQTIMGKFTVTKMMDEMESFLQEVAYVSTTEKTSQLEPLQNTG
jgi:hypothetical protein